MSPCTFLEGWLGFWEAVQLKDEELVQEEIVCTFLQRNRKGICSTLIKIYP
jgi:hypothetical protein